MNSTTNLWRTYSPRANRWIKKNNPVVSGFIHIDSSNTSILSPKG